MLRIRLHHLVLALLLHIGGVLFFWWGGRWGPKRSAGAACGGGFGGPTAPATVGDSPARISAGA